MNVNVALDYPGLIAWDGTTAYPRLIGGYVSFGFTFEATAAIATDAVFGIESAPASAADPCLPGTFTPVNKILTCAIPSETNQPETITIPAGTKAGQLCMGTLPCTPDKFIRLTATSGDTAKIKAVLTVNGQGV